jgi:hypothetical protein
VEKTKVMVEFEISGDKFDPNALTELLGINPTETRKKGEPGRLKHIVNKHSIWLYSTRYKESNDVGTQLKDIFDIFKDKTAILKEIKNNYDVEMGICVVIKVENKEPPAMSFRRWFMKFLHEIDADVDFDMYIL